MGEVKTEPVTATYQGTITDDRWTEAETWPAGGFGIEDHDRDGTRLWYRCPCGCDHVGFLRVGRNEKPAKSPSWNWNGSTEKPTLKPSVHHVGHWHGWLTDGVWRSC